MKKISKQLVALLLAVVMVLPMGVLSANPFVTQAEAASITESTVTSKLNSISNEYKGKAFSKNKSRCTNHSNEQGCSNCHLGSILDAKGISKSSYNYNGYTCWAFASYCFTQCFGKMWVSDNYISIPFKGTRNEANVKSWLTQYASIGDIICWDGHYVVITGLSSSNITIMDANYGGDSSRTGIVRHEQVSFSYIAKHSGLKLHHAINYNTSKVTFNGNGGTPSSTSEYFIVGKIHGDYMPSATRDGYTFDGWYTSASGGTRVIRSSTVTSGNKTLYAHWTKNHTDVLEVGHVYRIYSENSGLVAASNGSGSGALVSQRNKGEKGNGELWRVTAATGDGYYSFENLNGGMALDVDADDRYAYGASLQIYTKSNHNAQKFSIIKRGDKSGYSGVYSIHSKHSGRAIDVSDSSTKSGAALHQWDFHGGKNQLFYFEEVEKRNVTFYDNFNNNYISSPAEEYENINSATPKAHYSSRNTEYTKVTLKPETDSLYIQALKAGSSGKDLKFDTLINGSYYYDFAQANESTMVLKFKAKSSVSGAKMYFRWGYENNFVSVTLTNSWADYSVELKRTKISGSSIHPYIDRACNIEMSDIALYEKGTTGYIGDTDAYTAQTVVANVNDDYIQPAPLPKNNRSGYVFIGWFTKRVGGTRVAGAAEYFTASLDGNTKLYAHWTKSEAANYTLSYNANGGSGAPSSQSGATSYTVSSTKPTRSGYTFLGWSTNSSATSAAYVGGNTISLSANTTLYAVWQKNAATTYTLTYNANGGTDAPSSQTFSENDALYISDVCPSRFGYTFSGWKTSDGWWYYPGQSAGFFESTTLYAQWDSWSVYTDQSVVFMLDSTTKEGYVKFVPDESGCYVFESKKVYEDLDTVGYLYDSNKNEIAMGDDEGENSNFRFSANLTKGNTYYLYVKGYSANTEGEFRITVTPAYTVTFDANGGYDAPDALYGDYVYTIPYDEPVREGYEFLGWSAYEDFTFADICAGDEIEIDGNVTLYAVWKESYYTIKYYISGDLHYTQECGLNEDTIIIYDVPEKFPYTFTGWKEVGYDGGKTYYPGEELTLNDNLELYAAFEHYSITRNEQQNYEFTEKVPTYWVEFVTEVSGEYVIKSLSDGSDSDTYCKMYDGDQNYIVGNDDDIDKNFAISVYLTAGERYYFLIGINGEYPGSADLVISRAYNLSYDTNGGEGDFRTQSGDSTYTIPVIEPYRDGYVFVGWSKNKNATDADCHPGDIITVDSETTLYAVWEEADVPVDPGYDPDDPMLPGLLTIRTPSITTIKYGDTIKLHADMGNAPVAGLKVEWEFSNDNFEIVSISKDGRTCTITPSKSGQTTFTAKVKLGSRLLSSDTKVMTSKAGFFDKLIAFFREIFGLLKNYEQAIGVMFY